MTISSATLQPSEYVFACLILLLYWESANSIKLMDCSLHQKNCAVHVWWLAAIHFSQSDPSKLYHRQHTCIVGSCQSTVYSPEFTASSFQPLHTASHTQRQGNSNSRQHVELLHVHLWHCRVKYQNQRHCLVQLCYAVQHQCLWTFTANCLPNKLCYTAKLVSVSIVI